MVPEIASLDEKKEGSEYPDVPPGDFGPASGPLSPAMPGPVSGPEGEMAKKEKVIPRIMAYGKTQESSSDALTQQEVTKSLNCFIKWRGLKVKGKEDLAVWNPEDLPLMV